MRQIAAITWKDLKIFFKDPGAVVLIFLMPLMFIVLMSYALAEPFGSVQSRKVELLVVNQDEGSRAKGVLEQLNALQAFRAETRWQGQTLNRDKLEELVRDGQVDFGLVFEPGFSRALESGGGDKPLQISVIVDPSTPGQVVEPVLGTLRGLTEQARMAARVPGEIEALLDTMVPGPPAPMRAALVKRAKDSVSRLLSSKDRPVVVARAAPRGSQAVIRPDAFQQNVPGYTLFGIFWIVVLLAESVFLERRDGTFRRLLISPMSRTTMLFGKLFPYFLINLLQIVLMLGVARLVFGLDLGNSISGLLAVSLAASAAATGLGVLVAALARTEAQARGLTILVLLTLSALGGCFVPRFIMPQALQTAGLITPHAWALDAYQDLLVRGYGLGEVLPEVGVLVAFAFFFFAIGTWRFRFN